MTPSSPPSGKSKTLAVYLITIIFGFLLFIIPNLFFGIFKVNGGLKGINLAIIAIFQLVTVTTLIHFSLKYLGKNFSHIGWSSNHWLRDTAIGVGVTLIRALVVFGYVIPNTGGAERPDVQEVITALDGTAVGLIALIMLGALGGGIAEELYNRGFFINILKDVFNNKKVGLWFAATLSILFFSVGHMPSSPLLWFDILAASLIYTCLFLATGRLTSSIMAHASWNTIAILIINYSYL